MTTPSALLSVHESDQSARARAVAEISVTTPVRRVSRSVGSNRGIADATCSPLQLTPSGPPLRGAAVSKQFNDIVFVEEAGRVYGPIETDKGLHLLYLHSCRGGDDFKKEKEAAERQ